MLQNAVENVLIHTTLKYLLINELSLKYLPINKLFRLLAYFKLQSNLMFLSSISQKTDL
jgi:hypothetical protein